MGNAKRERRKAFKAEKRAVAQEQQRRDDVAQNILQTIKKDKVLSVAGKGALALYAYNFMSKTGLPLPSARNHIPEPLDLPDHIGNVYWSLVFMGASFSKVRNIPFLRDMCTERYPLVKAMDYRKNGDEGALGSRYRGVSIAAAAATASVVHMSVEAASDIIPQISVLTGGADPLDVVYGTAVAAIGMAWQTHRVEAAIAEHSSESIE